MDYSATEMMTIAAARALKNDDVCFVGIGAPSAACNLARLTHAPQITLIYESGTIGTKPDVLPLSIGDGELCDTAVTTVPVVEIFNYWLQGGRLSIGFLGVAQIDRFGNINTTVVGPYDRPKVRLPGSGGAPEIATSCGEVFVIARHEPRVFVDRLDFVTSLGHGDGTGIRRTLGLTSAGPSLVVTDLCLMRPDPETYELVVSSVHEGADASMIREKTGWPVRFKDDLELTPAPTDAELEVLRDLHARTARAHGGAS
jgi:glutaconate CoA-transferase, subunit B